MTAIKGGRKKLFAKGSKTRTIIIRLNILLHVIEARNRLMTRTIVIIVRNICWELYWLFKAENITIIMTSKKVELAADISSRPICL